MKYIILCAILAAISVAYQYGTVEYHTAVVDSKKRVTTGQGDALTHKYIVFTDSRTFENTDSLFHLKWNSSDLQGKLKVGQEYRFKTYGWRFPLFSMYENIVSVEEIGR